LGGTRIEIIAIGNNMVYSVGAVVVSPRGDVYLIHRFKDSDFHMSRHASGERHWTSTKTKLFEKIGKGKPIEEFEGIESLGTSAFGVDSLPRLYKEYKMKKYDGIFCIDMRQFMGKPFNMLVSILTKEGLSSLVSNSERLENRQICLFPECTPMVAVTVGTAKLRNAKNNS
jgi:hypothetical protein